MYSTQGALDLAPVIGSLNTAGTGELNSTYATVTTSASVSAGEVIYLRNLPQGVIVHPELSYVICASDPGATLTVDIGDAGNADRYGAAIVLSSGGSVNWNSATLGVAATVPYVTDSTEYITATVASASAINNDVTLLFKIVYTQI